MLSLFIGLALLYLFVLLIKLLYLRWVISCAWGRNFLPWFQRGLLICEIGLGDRVVGIEDQSDQDRLARPAITTVIRLKTFETFSNFLLLLLLLLLLFINNSRINSFTINFFF
ncbi:hypothetical protein BY996DRAFT_7147328 [Phakopsora pachyrhizi]|nr:hypothetical protein BY996DRAFT_7147328 [Phakopsora pachyrhizi]